MYRLSCNVSAMSHVSAMAPVGNGDDWLTKPGKIAAVYIAQVALVGNTSYCHRKGTTSHLLSPRTLVKSDSILQGILNLDF